jgi:peptidylprolyl isomerase
MKALVVAIALAATLVASGCGSDDSSNDGAAQANTTTAPASTKPPTPQLKYRIRQEPAVEARDGAPPKGLVKRDLIEGSGGTADLSKEVTIDYVGFDYETGRETGNTWEKGKVPSHFELRSGFVIKGLQKGIMGMKMGGRRELVIPPNLAFGVAGAAPEIPPNATMVYIVDLLLVEPIAQ